MPFGSKNALTFYTIMIKVLQKECIILFNDIKHVVQFYTPLVNIYCNSKTIIDDILLYSNHILTLLHFFSCVVQVFTKYRFSFKLNQCDLFLPCVKYVGYDLIAGGNFPVQSKFQLINNWNLPPHGVSLLSLIGLWALYRNYVPWFESNIKQLRRLQRVYHRQSFANTCLVAHTHRFIGTMQRQHHYINSSPPIW